MVVQKAEPYLKTKVSVAQIDLTFWSTFPKLAVDFNQVFIQDALEGSTLQDTLLYTDQIRLKFNPVDIYHEKYHVESIEIAPGALHLKTTSEGKVNYDIFQSDTSSVAEPFNLNLEKVHINGLHFEYADQQSDQTHQLLIEDLALIGKFSEKEFNLQTKATAWIKKIKSGEIALIKNQKTNFDVSLSVNTQSGLFQLEKSTIFIANLPFTAAGKVDEHLIDFQINSNNIQLTDFLKHFNISQSESIEKLQGNGNIDFQLKLLDERKADKKMQINCAFNVENGSITEPNTHLKIRGINIQGNYQSVKRKGDYLIQLKRFNFYTSTGPFSGKLKISHFNQPILAGFAHGKINLKAIHKIFKIPGIETLSGTLDLNTLFKVKLRPNQAQEKYEILQSEGNVNLYDISTKLVDDKRLFYGINGAIYLKKTEAGIKNLQVKTGKSDLEINGIFQNLQGYLNQQGNIKANVDLKADCIRIEDLSTATKEEIIQDGRKFIIPLDIEGTVFTTIKKLTYANHTFESIEGNLYLGNRVFNFPSIRFMNAGALIAGAVKIEERSPEMFYVNSLVESNNIHFKPLFREWDNFKQDVIQEDNIQGKANVKLVFEAPFDLRSGILMDAIRAQIYLKVMDGKLVQVKSFQSIIKSVKESSVHLALGKKNIALMEEKLKNLSFETLENTFTIENSLITVPKMKINSSLLDIELAGTHQFNNHINYQFVFRFRDLKSFNSEEEFGEIMDDGSGFKIFMKMTGNIENPIISWDKKSKKEQAKENREQAKMDAKSIFKSEFGLYKNDTTVKKYDQQPKNKEVITIQFNPEKDENPFDLKKPKKDTKLKKKLDAWKKEQEDEKEESIEIAP